MDKKYFWPTAKCFSTKKRHDPGCKKIRMKIDLLFGNGSFVRLRKYRNKAGDVKTTIEVEI